MVILPGMDNTGDPFTRLLKAASDDPAAAGKLLNTAYTELRAIAARQLRGERRDHTLQPTALVNEVYLRLFAGANFTWENRGHFFGSAAETMRHILIEHARNRGRLKRGGGRKRVPLTVVDVAAESDETDVEAVDAAITKLEQQDADLAKVVKLRFFAGLTNDQIAATLDSSERSVRRDWKLAQAFMARELGKDFDVQSEQADDAG